VTMLLPWVATTGDTLLGAAALREDAIALCEQLAPGHRGFISHRETGEVWWGLWGEWERIPVPRRGVASKPENGQ